MDLAYVCVCGHVTDEHEEGFFRPCTLCNCEDYEGTDLDDEEE